MLKYKPTNLKDITISPMQLCTYFKSQAHWEYNESCEYSTQKTTYSPKHTECGTQHQDKQLRSVMRTGTCLPLPVRPSPFFGELFFPQLHQAEAAPFLPLLSSRGWPRVTEVNPVKILPWDFYNGTRDRKSLCGAESTKCNSGAISSLPCQWWERIKPKTELGSSVG